MDGDMYPLPRDVANYGRPRTRFNGRTIARALEIYLIPPVLRECHIIAIRCIFDLRTREECVAQLAARRRLLEKKLLEQREVYLVISAITALPNSRVASTSSRAGDSRSGGDAERSEASVGGRQTHTREEGAACSDGNVNDDCLRDTRARSADGNDCSMKPGVSFWIASKMHEVAVGSTQLSFMKMFHACGFTIEECKVVKSRGSTSREADAKKTLLTCIKDFNWQYAINLACESTEHYLTHVVVPTRDEVVNFEHHDPQFGKKVVRISLNATVPFQVAECIRKGLRDITYARLDYDFVDLAPKEEGEGVVQSVELPGPSSGRCKLTAAVNLLVYSLDSQECRYRNSFIYKKEKDAVYTYSKMWTVREYVGKLCKLPQYRELLTETLERLVSLLDKNPHYEGVPQLQIDHNIIEVKHGWCIDLQRKTFVRDPIEQCNVGVITPRAFLQYSYDPNKIPNPIEFRESLENSFPDDGTLTRFVQMLYQLLLHRKFPFKSPKMFVVGPPNSGKTTWFAPIQAVIELEFIATATREGKFAAHMISENTEVVFIDEWSPDCLKLDDAKTLLQGGIQFLPQKHGEARRLIYNSGFYITANSKPDFGETIDADALWERLHIFKTKRLPNVTSGVRDLFQRDAAHILHWMMARLADVPLFGDQCALLGSPACNVPPALNESSISCEVDDVDLHEVDSSILPERSVQLAHLAVYDSDNRYQNNELPYRIVVGCEQNSEMYHRSVYLGLTGRYRDYLSIPLGTHELFATRRSCSWDRLDSLYDAWLLSNFHESRSLFNGDVFQRRYPNWKLDVVRMDLREEEESGNPSATAIQIEEESQVQFSIERPQDGDHEGSHVGVVSGEEGEDLLLGKSLKRKRVIEKPLAQQSIANEEFDADDDDDFSFMRRGRRILGAKALPWSQASVTCTKADITLRAEAVLSSSCPTLIGRRKKKSQWSANELIEEVVVVSSDEGLRCASTEFSKDAVIHAPSNKISRVSRLNTDTTQVVIESCSEEEDMPALFLREVNPQTVTRRVERVLHDVASPGSTTTVHEVVATAQQHCTPVLDTADIPSQEIKAVVVARFRPNKTVQEVVVISSSDDEC